jgi:hypothetical protein
MIQANLAEFIDNYRDPVHLKLLQQVAQNRGLSATQETGQDGDRQWLFVEPILIGLFHLN